MNITRLSLMGLTLLILSGMQATPAWAVSHWRRADVACGNGLRLQRASGVPGGAVHTYVFEGFCSLLSDYDTGGWVEGHPPLSATARWDKASGTYTETLHLLAPRKFTILLTRGERFTAEKDYRVGTGPEEATFKCDVDPVINRTSHCTLITQHNGTGWGGRNDGFAWKARHNQPLLAGRATAKQARRTAATHPNPTINCRGLRLTGASGVPNGKTRRYLFNGTCSLRHTGTSDASGSLQPVHVRVGGDWVAADMLAQEDVYVVSGLPKDKGGGGWVANYTCTDDPWINGHAQCSTMAIVAWTLKTDVFDQVNELAKRHPVTAGMVNAAQAAKLSRAHHGSVGKLRARIDCSGLHLTGATGVPRKRKYTFSGTCRLYRTKDGSQGLQVTRVMIWSDWNSTYKRAREGVRVFAGTGAGIKGSSWWNTSYTCNEDPWLNGKAQCSKTVRRGRDAPVYDPITDLMDRHPVALGMANASQVAKLPRVLHYGFMKPLSAKRPILKPGKYLATKSMVLPGQSRSPSLLKPKLTIQYAIASSTKACDANRLLRMNVIIRNEGGVPLPAHTRFAYVHAVESGGAHLTSPKVSLPAIPARKTWRGVFVIGAKKSFFPKLPGRHTLVVSIGPDHTAPGTLAYIPPPPFRTTVNFPAGYCQQPQYRRIGTLMSGTTRGATLSPKMKLSPKIKLSPRMQLRLNR